MSLEAILPLFARVFTLQSIKSRIETILHSNIKEKIDWFLLYSPLNQGLKLPTISTYSFTDTVFTLQSIKSRIETKREKMEYGRRTLFLLYSPLNQGLKPTNVRYVWGCDNVFNIHSIKSRIETILR